MTGKYLTGDKVDDAVSRWHEGAGAGQELHEYLGWTHEEYAHWFETGRLPREGRPE